MRCICKVKLNLSNSNTCKWCNIQFCFSCLSIEQHNCTNSELCIKNTKITLEQKLSKITDNKNLCKI